MKLLATMAIVLATVSAGCSTPSKTAQSAATPAKESAQEMAMPVPVPDINRHSRLLASDPAQHIPKAKVYRMNGDYADRVPITLGPDGTILSYPATTDITPSQAPIQLADGWWLDRRGITPQSVFTRYTYSEYASLPATPTSQELKDAIIPGAWPYDVTTLPMTTSEAVADTAAVNAWIRANTPMLTLPKEE